MRFWIFCLVTAVAWNYSLAQSSGFQTPRSAFNAYRDGINKRDWSQFGLTLSPNLKKYYLGEVFFNCYEAGREYEKKLNDLLRTEGFVFADLVNTHGEFDQVLDHLSENQSFEKLIADGMAILVGDDPWLMGKIRMEISDLQVEQQRARGIVQFIDRSMQNDQWVFNRSSEEMYFRQYQGGWVVCLQPEWENPEWLFKYNAFGD